MATSSRIPILFLLLCCLAYGLFKLSEGYFPRPVALSGVATFDEQQDALWNRLEEIKEIKNDFGFGKKIGMVAIVVIDALRYDFATSNESAMEFLKGLIKAQRGCAWPAYAHPPTVTLPRLKALTSGSIPNFLDVILNFASEEFHVDSFVKQLNLRNKSIGSFSLLLLL
jgi:ethanolaminephosphotransferase